MSVTQEAMAQQIELEKMFSKNQLIPRMTQYFKDEADTDFPTYILEQGFTLEFGISFLVQLALHKRCDLQTMYGLMRHHADTAQEVVNLLLKAAEADLCTYCTGTDTFIVAFELPMELQAELDMFQYPLPMVVEPAELKNNRQTGYLTTGGSVILKNNHHDGDVCLEHLNAMNKIKLCLNMDVVNFVSNSWKNLDKPKPGESGEDFTKRKKAFAKYDRTAKQVASLLSENTDHFHLTHRPDKRGRTYCQGYHVTYQGNSWNKAVVELYDREHIV